MVLFERKRERESSYPLISSPQHLAKALGPPPRDRHPGTAILGPPPWDRHPGTAIQVAHFGGRDSIIHSVTYHAPECVQAGSQSPEWSWDSSLPVQRACIPGDILTLRQVLAFQGVFLKLFPKI